MYVLKGCYMEGELFSYVLRGGWVDSRLMDVNQDERPLGLFDL